MKSELDRISELSAGDPLNGLDQILGLMQGINFEMVKEYAPILLENARLTGDKFAASGQIIESKREGSRTFNQFLRLQEAITKLGVAQTRVRDERERRKY